MEALYGALAILIAAFATLIPYLSATSSNSAVVALSADNRDLFLSKPSSVGSNATKTLKSLLYMLKNQHRNDTDVGLSLNILNRNNAAIFGNNSLSFLYRLGNDSSYVHNLTTLAETMNRTGRSGYGGWGGGGGYGGGWGGGLDPALLLLLKDDNKGGCGWGCLPPWFGQNQQQSSSSSNSDMGQMALLTLLGLALIGRMPTQG